MVKKKATSLILQHGFVIMGNRGTPYSKCFVVSIYSSNTATLLLLPKKCRKLMFKTTQSADLQIHISLLQYSLRSCDILLCDILCYAFMKSYRYCGNICFKLTCHNICSLTQPRLPIQHLRL